MAGFLLVAIGVFVASFMKHEVRDEDLDDAPLNSGSEAIPNTTDETGPGVGAWSNSAHETDPSGASVGKTNSDFVSGIEAFPDSATDGRPLRTWTSSVGSTITARLVSLTGNKVKLEADDGRLLTVLLSELSGPDQEYTKNLLNTRTTGPRAGLPD
jgi:hypothetical protein